jgi:hypothetical protein
MSDFETLAEVWRNKNFPGADRLAKIVKEKHPNKDIRNHQTAQFFVRTNRQSDFQGKKEIETTGTHQ